MKVRPHLNHHPDAQHCWPLLRRGRRHHGGTDGARPRCCAPDEGRGSLYAECVWRTLIRALLTPQSCECDRRVSSDLRINWREPEKDKRRKEYLEDCFDAWVRCCDEAETAQEQNSFVEENSSNALQGTKETCESVEKQTKSCRRKSLAVVPEQQHTKSQHLEADLRGLVDLVEQHSWDKDKAEMISLWAACKNIPMTPSIFVNAKAGVRALARQIRFN